VRKPFPALAAACAALSLPVGAADIETVVVTASRAEQPGAEVPASIRALTADELAGIGAVHISEALARVPGTWISRGNGQEHLTAIRSPVFTGAGSCGAFYMAEDGVPLRPTGFCNVNELSEVNSEQAGRIEVLRGPGTAMHGANAQHGVINVISAAPPEGGATRAALEGGPHGYARLLGSHGSGDANGGWLLTANLTHDGGYKDESGFDQQKLGLRFDHVWEGVRLESLLSYANLEQETAGFVIGEDAYKDSNRQKENPNPEAFRDNRVARWYGRFSLDDTGLGDFSLTPYWRWQDMRFLQHFLVGAPLEENGLDSAGVQGGWRVSPTEALEIRSGLDFEWSEGWLEETQDAPVPGISTLPAGKHYDYNVQGLNTALFSQLEWRAREGTRLLGGLRSERQAYDYDNRMIDGAVREDGTPCGPPGAPLPCRYSRPADRDDSFAEWSLNAGLVQDIGERHALFLNLAHGFRPPQAAELYRLQAGQLVADIDSEAIDSLEIGWRGAWADLAWDVSAYAMDKDNVIYQDADRRNVGNAQTRHRGIEYTLAWQFAARWSLAADGTLARHTYESDDRLQGLPPGTSIEGNEMDTAPRSMASMRLAWEPTERTRAELEWQHLGEHYLEPTESFEYAGHDLAHLRVRHQLAAAWGVSLRVTNLTDEEYAERADYAFGNYRYFIGEPRSVFVEVEWQR
jgi:outer membrane receptor protein involved in Fe transport